MSNRIIPTLGVVAAGGVGYYLYSAGGDPKLAEKKAERMYSNAHGETINDLTSADDAANAIRRVKGDFPGQDKEAKKAGEEGYEAVRSTAQQYVCSCITQSKNLSLTMHRPTQQGESTGGRTKARPIQRRGEEEV
tara:strand:- start:15280 stop:15684 length:405 start_codon:yes stop_codon:yes gene_type:complete